MTGTPAPTLTFDVHGSDDQLIMSSYELVVAGYTGRDERSVRRHIDELAAIGVPPPDSVPMFYELDADLATQKDKVDVAGTNSSGEVEPVLVRADGRLYLTIGSDHTDRDVERQSVERSKAACPKPIGRTVVPLPRESGVDWDKIEVTCSVDAVDYQDGRLDTLRRPLDVLRMYDDQRDGHDRDLVIFGGTIPLLDGAFISGSAWSMALTLPNVFTVELSYSTSVSPRAGR